MKPRKIIDENLESGQTIVWKENVENNQGLSFQAIITSLTNSGGYIEVSQSLDETNFQVLKKINLTGEPSPINFSLDEYSGYWLRVRVVSVTNVAENISIWMADGGVFVAPWGVRKISVEFARGAATTPDYAVNDVISAGDGLPIKLLNVVRKPGGSGKIVGLSIMKDNANAGTSLRMHLYSSVPTVIADNAPFTLLYANRAGRIASRDLTFATEGSGSDAAYCELQDQNIEFKCDADSTDITVVLETKAAFTPVNGAKYYITAWVNEYPA